MSSFLCDIILYDETAHFTNSNQDDVLLAKKLTLYRSFLDSTTYEASKNRIVHH